MSSGESTPICRQPSPLKSLPKKADRADLILLALSSLLIRGGERRGVLPGRASLQFGPNSVAWRPRGCGTKH